MKSHEILLYCCKKSCQEVGLVAFCTTGAKTGRFRDLFSDKPYILVIIYGNNSTLKKNGWKIIFSLGWLCMLLTSGSMCLNFKESHSNYCLSFRKYKFGKWYVTIAFYNNPCNYWFLSWQYFLQMMFLVIISLPCLHTREGGAAIFLVVLYLLPWR